MHGWPIWVDFFNTIGRSLPVVITAHAGQVECKRLVSTNAIDWPVAMQLGGQVLSITHAKALRSLSAGERHCFINRVALLTNNELWVISHVRYQRWELVEL